jgi:oxygen-independent coproporphyrinogen-3 oxidase
MTGRAIHPASSPPVGLYVHVPFCVSLCPYCDFVVLAGANARGPRNRIDAFMAGLLTEIDLRADALDATFGPPGAARLPGSSGRSASSARPASSAGPPSSVRPPLQTVYLGGGTPSLLQGETLTELLDVIRRRFGLAPGAEVTLEANPGPDERGDPVDQRRAGVTRLSFGAQSLDPGELGRLGRRHRPEDVAEAVATARAAGIGSVSLDLLYDVPGQSVAGWMSTLRAALELAPDHLSLYALTLDDPDGEGLTGPTGDHLPTRPGARRWRARARTGQDEDRAAAQYTAATELLDGGGWRGYEISNWARPGHASRHNLIYWQRRSFEAVGPGAHAFDRAIRRWNAARLDGYLAALRPADGSPPRLPPGGAESLDAAVMTSERLILGLRTDRGVPASALRGPRDGVLRWAMDASLLRIDDDRRARLTTRGRLLSNEIFARLV